METPVVSIITPAFNCRNTIKETFESIKKQSFSSWEWIVIDDHSSDGSFEYIKEMIKDDNRVLLLQTERNSGAAIARNIGIQKAKGRYIAFLDSDDLWKPNKLENQIAFMNEKNCSFAFTNYDLLYSDGSIRKHRIKKDIVTYKQLLKTNYIGCLTVIYDTSILGKVYMPLDCEKREDHGTWLDITRNGTNAFRLDEFLSIYRISNGTVSSKKFEMMKYQYRLYRKHEKFCLIKSLWLTVVCSLNKILKKY